MIFKITNTISNLYKSIKNTDSLTRKELGKWLSDEYNNIPNELMLTKYENEIPNACLKLVYIYVNTQLLKLNDFEYKNISDSFMLDFIVKTIHKQFKYPSIISKWYCILFEEMELQQFGQISFDYNQYKDHKIDIDNFIIHILKWNINPTFFGIFIEQVIAYALGGHIQNTNSIHIFKKQSFVFNQHELFKINTMFSKITKNIIWCENFYYNSNCKSIYHYFAFLSLISNLNFEEYIDSYLLLIERLDTDFIQKELKTYLQNLYNNQQIILLFELDKQIEYQKEVNINNIHGYIDIVTPNSIIDIKAYNNILKNSNENSSTIIQWYFQIYLYDFCLDDEKNNYIVFNPITNIIRIWKSNKCFF